MVVTRASDKCHTAHEARLPHHFVPMGLKDGVVGETSQKALVQEHRAPCLQQHARMSFGWRRASHFVTTWCVLFVAWVASTLGFTVCDLFYGCSGVWMLLVWSVLLGFFSEFWM